MSGKVPAVGGLGGGAAIALLPNTGGSRVLFWVALTAVVVGMVTMTISGVMAFRQRASR